MELEQVAQPVVHATQDVPLTKVPVGHSVHVAGLGLLVENVVQAVHVEAAVEAAFVKYPGLQMAQVVKLAY